MGGSHIDLDAINWQAGWRDLNTHDPEEFVRRVEAACAQDVWVSCGNYSRVRPIYLGRATHLVWLDYPKWLVMGRVIRRSIARAITGDELWPGTGNRETFARWLDKEHPIRWAWDTYADRKARYAAMFDDPALAHLSRHRLTDPRRADGLVAALAAEFQSSRDRPAPSAGSTSPPPPPPPP